MLNLTAARPLPASFALFGALLAFTAPAMAQTYPDKPIKLIVSFAPGGLVDTIARAIQPRLNEGLGQPVVIDNRPGGGGTIAESALAHSPPDGYTIMMTADGLPANRHLVPNLSYDSFKDLTPVSLLTRIPLVMVVNPAVPAKDVKSFVEYARANPGKLSYASPGIGTSNHLFFEVFRDEAHIDLQHVPYRGGAPAMADVIGGQVPVTMLSVTLVAPQIRADKLRGLAITSDKRSPLIPNVPTFAEAGYPDFKPQQWAGLFVPAGTPPAVVQRLTAEFAKALKTPDVVARLSDLGAEVVMSSQAEFTALLHRDDELLGKLIRERQIKGQ